MLAAVFVITLVLGWRVAFDWASRHVARASGCCSSAPATAPIRLARELYERRRSSASRSSASSIRIRPVSVQPVLNPGVVGTIEDIPSIVRALSVDRVVVSLADARGKLPMDKLLEMKLDGVAFDHLASVYEEYTGKIAVENLRPSWLIFSEGFRKRRRCRPPSGSSMSAAPAVGLLLAAPVMLLVALAVKLTSRGPVLYHQQRVGQHGRVFTVHKFRSMRAGCRSRDRARSGPARRTIASRRSAASSAAARLDELPQLWNVLRGDMSLVGPRPERPEFVAELTQADPVLRPAPRRQAGPHRLGAGVATPTAPASRTRSRSCSTTCSTSRTCRSRSTCSSLFETIKTVLLRRGGR